MERIKNGFDVEFFCRGEILHKRVYLADIKKFTNDRKHLLSQNRWAYSFYLTCDNKPVRFEVSGEKMQNAFKLAHLNFNANAYTNIPIIDFYRFTTF